MQHTMKDNTAHDRYKQENHQHKHKHTSTTTNGKAGQPRHRTTPQRNTLRHRNLDCDGEKIDGMNCGVNRLAIAY